MWRLREAARPLLGLPKLSSEDLATYPATTSGARICRRTASSSRSQTCTRPRVLAQASIRTTSDLYVPTEIEDIAARMAELEVAQHSDKPGKAPTRFELVYEALQASA